LHPADDLTNWFTKCFNCGQYSTIVWNRTGHSLLPGRFSAQHKVENCR